MIGGADATQELVVGGFPARECSTSFTLTLASLETLGKGRVHCRGSWGGNPQLVKDSLPVVGLKSRMV